MPSHSHLAASFLLLSLTLLGACSRPPTDDSNSSPSQKLPFDRKPKSTGVSPSQSLLPSITKLPEGTPIPMRLQNAISSASSHTGDTFHGTIDEPVVIDGQVLVAAGTSATGRVLEAKASAGSREPGYLRIVLVSLNIGDRPVMIETSSIFAKGGARDERNKGPAQASGAVAKARDRDIAFNVDRRLDFRLAQAVDLPQ